MKTYLLLICLLITSVHASVSKGKELFTKQCRSCHIEGKYFAGHKKAKAWAKFLETDKLIHLHKEQNLSLPYLSSKAFQKDKKHFKALFKKYAKDKVKHNSCY